MSENLVAYIIIGSIVLTAFGSGLGVIWLALRDK